MSMHSLISFEDALLGLRELLEANPELIEPSLTTLLNTCARIIGDEVRTPVIIDKEALLTLVEGCERPQNPSRLFVLASPTNIQSMYDPKMCTLANQSNHAGKHNPTLIPSNYLHHIRSNPHIPRNSDRCHTFLRPLPRCCA